MFPLFIIIYFTVEMSKKAYSEYLINSNEIQVINASVKYKAFIRADFNRKTYNISQIILKGLSK